MRRRLRTLIDSDRFRRERAELIPHPALADALLQRVLDAISVKPEMGQPTDQPGVYAVPTEPSPVMEAVVIYYAYHLLRLQ